MVLCVTELLTTNVAILSKQAEPESGWYVYISLALLEWQHFLLSLLPGSSPEFLIHIKATYRYTNAKRKCCHSSKARDTRQCPYRLGCYRQLEEPALNNPTNYPQWGKRDEASLWPFLPVRSVNPCSRIGKHDVLDWRPRWTESGHFLPSESDRRAYCGEGVSLHQRRRSWYGTAGSAHVG